uniref:Peptidase inhibitor 16 n=1 Tax=Haplochromis burtoni TaxID=8153 RepID=A0A3Q2VN06_HAPBU
MHLGRCSPLRRAPLWVWLLLGALVVPGAWSFLNEEQEEMLVELHNHFRGQVSPSASAMIGCLQKWDPNLKVVAEGYAAKCIWNHNPELEDTGENLYAGTGPLDLRMALEKWFLERLDYDFQNNSCDEDKMCGHYTQMVWADTHRVGCAFHLCDTMEGLDWDRVSFLVCNYYPAGNYEGVRPYVEGDWCSRCPENLQKCENSLCGKSTVVTPPDLCLSTSAFYFRTLFLLMCFLYLI